jgi:hypothetical protein
MNIIILGSNRHPKFILQKLIPNRNIYPFDSLDMNPITGLDLVYDCIENDFRDFFSINYNMGYPCLKNYPLCKFYKHHDIKYNKMTQDKYKRRIDRFIIDYNLKENIYVYNISAIEFNSYEIVESFITSINKFSKILNQHKLLIYITYNNIIGKTEYIDYLIKYNFNNSKILIITFDNDIPLSLELQKFSRYLDYLFLK